jgi:hypothetical protein
MMMRRFGFTLLVSALGLSGIAALASGCPPTETLIFNAEIPFDGAALGACTGNETKSIPAEECFSSCPGDGAIAYCVGTSYTECSCVSPISPTCDSGCCGYSPIDYCKDKGTAKTDPSEGLCDADVGYLLCNGICFATFKCDLPDGYSLVVPDAGVDGAADSAHEASSDGAPDGSTDALGDGPASDADGGIDGSSDGAGDARDDG